MHHEPKELHLETTMPLNDGGDAIPVLVSVFLCEDDGSGYPCQIQIRKKGQSSKLWAELMPHQVKLLAKRLKSIEKWSKQNRTTVKKEEPRP